MRRKLNILNNEDGSVIVLTALCLVVLLGMSALVVDISVLFLHRLRLSNAADAAALAGVQELPGARWLAELKAREYGVVNGLREEEITVNYPSSPNSITVEVTREVPLMFGRILGFQFATVSAVATAQKGVSVAVSNVAPLSVQDQEFVYGQQYMLKEGPGDGEGQYKGNFGAIALDGHGASNYEYYFTHGYPGVLKVGDWVTTEPGNMAGPTSKAVNKRLHDEQLGYDCTFENADMGCRRVLIVPVITPYTKGGRHDVQILGFAAFYLEGTMTRKNGNDFYVVGRFIKLVVDGSIDEGANDYGVSSFALVR